MYRSCLNPPSSNGFRRGLISCIDLFDDDHAETMAALEAMSRPAAPQRRADAAGSTNMIMQVRVRAAWKVVDVTVRRNRKTWEGRKSP